MHLHFLHFVFSLCISSLRIKKKKKSKNLVLSRSREPSLVSRLVSWDKCLVTPLLFTIIHLLRAFVVQRTMTEWLSWNIFHIVYCKSHIYNTFAPI